MTSFLDPSAFDGEHTHNFSFANDHLHQRPLGRIQIRLSFYKSCCIFGTYTRPDMKQTWSRQRTLDIALAC